jgi:hypothetical protein
VILPLPLRVAIVRASKTRSGLPFNSVACQNQGGTALSQDTHYREERQDDSRVNNAAALATETLRHGSAPHHRKARAKEEEKISVFWRVFGGTLLSIGALVGLTIYNNLSATLTDLRRDLNSQIETRTDLVKKEDFNSRCASLWTGLKEAQTTGGALTALIERDKSLEQQIKAGEEDRKDLHRMLVEQNRTMQEERNEYNRKLEEQRKAADEERKEYARKLEDRRKASEDERKELGRELQKLGERLAAVEGRQAVKAAATGAEPAE